MLNERTANEARFRINIFDRVDRVVVVLVHKSQTLLRPRTGRKETAFTWKVVRAGPVGRKCQ